MIKDEIISILGIDCALVEENEELDAVYRETCEYKPDYTYTFEVYEWGGNVYVYTGEIDMSLEYYSQEFQEKLLEILKNGNYRLQ